MDWPFCFSFHRWLPEGAVKPADKVLSQCWGKVLVPWSGGVRKGALPIPGGVKHLGGKANEYATVLRKLARAGNEPAIAALSRLKEEIRKARARVGNEPAAICRAVGRTDASPVDLDPIARWKLAVDPFGQYALELLLWLWHARQIPESYKPFGKIIAECKPFDVDTSKKWWKLGRMVFLHAYRQPQEVPELRALATAPSYTYSAPRMRGYIVKRLGQRFLSFASPPKQPPDK